MPAVSFGVVLLITLVRLLIVCLISIIISDSDNIPSTKWPKDDEDISTHTLEFVDGWQSSEVSAVPEAREPESRQESPEPAPSQVNPHIKHSV